MSGVNQPYTNAIQFHENRKQYLRDLCVLSDEKFVPSFWMCLEFGVWIWILLGVSSYDSSSSRSSRCKFRIRLLSALMMAVARSRLFFCNSRIFSSTVSRAMSR